MVTFIEKSQIGSSKSSSPDKDREDSSRDVKEGGSSDQTSESWKAAISQVCPNVFINILICPTESDWYEKGSTT